MRTLRLLPALLPALLFILSCSSKEPFIKTIPFDGMRGNVQVCQVDYYRVNRWFGKISEGAWFMEDVRAFDEEGHLIAEGTENENGDVSICTYSYDNGVLLMKRDSSSYVSEDCLMDRKRGYEKYVTRITDDGKRHTFEYELVYDGLTRRRVVGGEVTRETVYDEAGLVVEEKKFGGDKVIGRTVYQYDENNDVVKEFEYDKDGSLSIYTYTYPEYDENGNWVVRHHWYDGEVGLISKRQITYR